MKVQKSLMCGYNRKLLIVLNHYKDTIETQMWSWRHCCWKTYFSPLSMSNELHCCAINNIQTVVLSWPLEFKEIEIPSVISHCRSVIISYSRAKTKTARFIETSKKINCFKKKDFVMKSSTLVHAVSFIFPRPVQQCCAYRKCLWQLFFLLPLLICQNSIFDGHYDLSRLNDYKFR